MGPVRSTLSPLMFCLAILCLAPGCSRPRSAAPTASDTPVPPSTPTVREGAREPLRSLRIASWNLEWLNRNDGKGPVARGAQDYARLRRYAERLAADVIAVQEVDGAEAVQRVFDSSQYQLQLARERGNQLGGFAIRHGLPMQRHPDLTALNTTGGLRSGVDISVHVNGTSLRLLGVHLKSGCFDAPLHGKHPSCRKLRAQLPRLEQWIDARAAENQPFVVLGDFNRQLRSGEAFYSELDDGEPPNADLTLLTDGRRSECWGGEYPNFIDHIALSKNAAPWLVEGSFAQQLFDAADARHRRRLSDHCPISVVLRPGAVSSTALAAPSSTPPAASPLPAPSSPPAASGAIKGNVSSRGKKLYHAPSCPQYERVQIDAARGERLFASEADAVAAGWQRSPDCP